jgi:inosine-uridine nucleoside N-ribohydrolase
VALHGDLVTAVPIVIDTDPGIDDALAIMLAAASPEVDIRGLVAVAGNVGLEQTSANAAALADLLRLNCPVGRGASGPLWRRDIDFAHRVHGENGLAGHNLPPSRRILEAGIPLLARLIEESPRPLTIVPIGPLTNIAMLVNQYPDTARKVERIVIMGGGTLDVLGNITPAAEFNIWFDPDAAARVFAFGVPITMVGLNATHQALVGRLHLPRLFASRGPIAEIVGRLLDGYRDGWGGAADAFPQHDSLAVAGVIDPEIITTVPGFVDVENCGRLTSGMTVVDTSGRFGEPNCEQGGDAGPARSRRDPADCRSGE